MARAAAFNRGAEACADCNAVRPTMRETAPPTSTPSPRTPPL
eukprot:CAMPEP_0183782550 /NCGR_PEP_ID=MMETSP0739-20130205/61278_1 /TAXON_ID=385413 /ORGANISM="Thalassiosira miniscula, Strain CCMP1093" /LENGTH=41 /DNA_ID= /DNA_START= /DNA_END= /DNA_ORIENTATION=